jgi:hypothetical protein
LERLSQWNYRIDRGRMPDLPERPKIATMQCMSHRARDLGWGFLLMALVIGMGAMEDWYGRFDYAGDAISYLDISNAIAHGEWHLALNPYWSIGYPLLVTATRWLFPAGPQGEWLAVHVVNLIVFVVTYVGFLYLLRMTAAHLARGEGIEPPPLIGFPLLAVGTSIFLLMQLLIGNVSRVSPDLAVSGAFFWLTGLSLRLVLQPRLGTAVVMGLLMGIGYVLKAIFLPIAAVFLVVVLYRSCLKRSEQFSLMLKLGAALAMLALIAVPYITANSMAFGRFTMGESGGLNYAWSVEGLPHWTHWQGGPAGYGTPVHPTEMVSANPPVFVFQEPFHVTYPPWFNPVYWYEGYHSHFSLRNQLTASRSNLSYLWHFLFRGPISMAAAVGAVIALGFLKERKSWWSRVVALWPLYVPSLLANGVYLLITVEPRYVVGFLIVILTVPFIPLFAPTPLVSRKVGWVLVLVVAVGSAAFLGENQRPMLGRAIRLQSYTSDEQWRLGLYLAEAGVRPGDQVASVKVGDDMLCTWAHVAGVHLVAEIGNDAFDPAGQDADFQLFSDDPAVQGKDCDLFRQAGASMVVAPEVSGAMKGAGWEQVVGTQAWIKRLR